MTDCEVFDSSLEILRDAVEECGFYEMRVYRQDDGRVFTELEYYTDCAGEDCIATIEGADLEEFCHELWMYLENFDAEDFEEDWIQMGKRERVERGAPERITDLLASAEEFERALTDLCERAVAIRDREAEE